MNEDRVGFAGNEKSTRFHDRTRDSTRACIIVQVSRFRCASQCPFCFVLKAQMPPLSISPSALYLWRRVRARAALLVTGATSDDKQKLENEPARERRRRR